MGGFLRGGRARVRHCRVRWRERLFVIPRFVCVEGPVVVRRSLAMVSHGWPVIRHPSEILLVVVLRPELIGSSTLGIVVVPAERTNGWRSVLQGKLGHHCWLHRCKFLPA